MVWHRMASQSGREYTRFHAHIDAGPRAQIFMTAPRICPPLLSLPFSLSLSLLLIHVLCPALLYRISCAVRCPLMQCAFFSCIPQLQRNCCSSLDSCCCNCCCCRCWPDIIIATSAVWATCRQAGCFWLRLDLVFLNLNCFVMAAAT